MKDSIRTRLFLGIILLSFLFTASSWLINSLFSRRFYLEYKKHKLYAVAAEVEELFDGEGFPDKLPLLRLEQEKYLYITVFNKYYEIIYDSMYSYPPPGMNQLNGNFPLPTVSQHPHYWIPVMNYTPHDPLVLNECFDEMLNYKYLEYITTIKHDHILRFWVSIAPIEESAQVANRLAFLTGFLALLIGCLLALFFTRWFSSPIIELKSIAEHMARLDFSRKYAGARKDEIGDLGHSINQLSNQLHDAICHLQRANSRLQDDIRKERRLEVMRQNFISSVSHELKTPLSLIQGYAEGLRSSVIQDRQDRIEYCDIIIDETARIDRLIRDLMDLSRFDSGSFSIKTREVDLRRLTENVLDKYKPIFAELKVTLVKDFARCSKVLADPVRIEQVLVNYINNALSNLDARRYLRLSLHDKGLEVRLGVYNSGKSIPEDELENIWVSFYRIDKARSREYGGTGLGLSIVRSIMKLHQSDYGVQNLSDGVEFWIDLKKRESLSA